MEALRLCSDYAAAQFPLLPLLPQVLIPMHIPDMLPAHKPTSQTLLPGRSTCDSGLGTREIPTERNDKK